MAIPQTKVCFSNWSPASDRVSMAGMNSGYDQFCPIAKASEILATRWTPLIMRELMADIRTLNDIHRGVPPGCWPRFPGGEPGRIVRHRSDDRRDAKLSIYDVRSLVAVG
jgi:hypothetical protein